MKILQQIIDLVYPKVCFCCGERISHAKSYEAETERKNRLWDVANYLCPSCIENLVILKDDICPKCGSPLRASGCPHCTKTKFSFIAARSVFLFDQHTRHLIHGLKYHDFIKIAPVLAAYASLYLENYWLWEMPEVIIPVPLHKIKKRERGFNQSMLIGKWIAEFTGIPCYDDILLRNRYTRTQTALNRQERHKNVSGAFTLAKPQLLKNKRVLILDDVFTSGSTCNAIAKLLKGKGITQVFVLTIARPS